MKLISILISICILISGCTDNLIHEVDRPEISGSHITGNGPKTGLVIFGVRNDKNPTVIWGIPNIYTAAWMYYDSGNYLFQVPGYNTILAAPFFVTCINPLFHKNNCGGVKYHVFSLDEGNYSLAYIEEEKNSFYNVGRFSNVEIIGNNYGESHSFSPNTTPNPDAPHFAVEAGKAVYIGDLDFSYAPTSDKWKPIIMIDSGDTRENAAEFAKSMGIATPLINEMWWAPRNSSHLNILPAKMK